MVDTIVEILKSIAKFFSTKGVSYREHDDLQRRFDLERKLSASLQRQLNEANAELDRLRANHLSPSERFDELFPGDDTEPGDG